MIHLLWLRPLRRRWFGCIRQRAISTRRRIPSLRQQRPCLELLEDRTAPAVFNLSIDPLVNTGGAVQELVNAINTANSNGQSNTINLFAGGVYDLTAVNNYWYGPDGLPPITSNLTINGNGATIQRDSSVSTPDFRLFYVSGGLNGELPLGSLTLENVTLQGGIARGGDSGLGGGGLGAGGAVFNQGTLNLVGATVTNNQVQGGGGGVLFFGNPLGNGGGGMGEDAPNASGEENQGGGFGSGFPNGYGGAGAVNNQYYNGGQLEGYSGGGGGGFLANAPGQTGSPTVGGNGGGLGGFGGSGGAAGSGGAGGDGGGGGWGPVFQGFGPVAGNFGFGGQVLSGGGVGGGGGGAAYVTTGGQFTFDNAGGGGFGGGGGGGGYGGDGGFGGGGGGTSGAGGAGIGRGGFGGGSGGSTGGGGAGMGGGIFSMFGSLTLTNCTFTGNSATGGSSKAGDGGSGFGGAIFNLDGQVQITFSTLAHNTVSAGGGNPAESGGTDVYNLAYGNNITNGSAVTATVAITDSILSNPNSINVDLFSLAVNGNHTNTVTVTLNDKNIVMSLVGTVTGTQPITSNPQLGALQNNGGPTETMAIPITSPALNVGTPVVGVTTDQRGQPRPSSDPSLGAYEPQFATTTDAFNATATFSRSDQDVTLSADVLNVGPNNVNSGTVTFTVMQGNTVIGSPVTSGTVNDNAASATYVLPGGTLADTYTIDAVYNPGGGFQGSSDNTHTLTVNPAGTAMIAADATSTYNESPQSLSLKANVTSSAGTVDEGTVTFTVKQGGTTIGTATTSATVSNGQASVNYLLPSSVSAGPYSIDAVYNPGADFLTSFDSTHKLTLNPATITMAADDATSIYNESTQSVTLTANVSSSAGPVNEGTVTFLLEQGNTIIGTATTSGTVGNGQVSVNYVLPAGASAGSYTIVADFNDSVGNFLPGNGLALQEINAAAAALDLSIVQIVPDLLNGTAQVTLTAQTNSLAGGVNQGVVNFSFAGASGQSAVNNSTASVQLVVPLSAVAGNQAFALTYTDNAAPANFASGNAANTLSLISWNALLPSLLTFAADGSETNTVSYFGLPLLFHYTSPGVSAGSGLGFVSTDPSNGGIQQFAANYFGWPLVIYIDLQELEAAVELAASIFYPPDPIVVTDFLAGVSALFPPEPIYPPDPFVTAVQLGPFDFFYAEGSLTGIEEFYPPQPT